MSDKIKNIVIDEVKAVLDVETKDINVETKLFGIGGILDSMSLVSMIVAVEQDIEDEFDVQITIADARAMSQKNSPFRTIGTLIEYINEVMGKEKI